MSASTGPIDRDVQIVLTQMLFEQGMDEWQIVFVRKLSRKRFKHVDWTKRVILISHAALSELNTDKVFKRRKPGTTIAEVQRQPGLARVKQQLKTMVTRIRRHHTPPDMKYLTCPICQFENVAYEAFKDFQCDGCNRVIGFENWKVVGSGNK